MNRANLKAYAPQARVDFIAAVTARANLLGISAVGASSAEIRGDVALIDGREWPARISTRRDKLVERIARRGFAQTMDEVAYTWFNRFAALRFMELHDYLEHGWRVLSSRNGGLPEILGHASEVSLGGLDRAAAREMQLAGNQDNELYKMLIVAQCNDLSRSMPFLFERIDDETELLLPENLLRTDSIVASLVESIPEEDWAQIEVIGWLYQFYISDRKAAVIGKVVKSEDIPAATQLFTPNWIVKYLVQNTLGRLWLSANPTSALAADWAYFLAPVEQPPEIRVEMETLIRERVQEDGERLNPESIKLVDPACGSGHILVEAYDVFKAIYLERGYRARDIPRLILEKNLFGIDIDDRAAQLSGFALLMKARADDRRLLESAPRINVVSLQETSHLDLDELMSSLGAFSIERSQMSQLLDTFARTKTFGSLVKIPDALHAALPFLVQSLDRAIQAGDLYAKAAAIALLPIVEQALVLSTSFDAVVANPPYMGNKFYDGELKRFVESNYRDMKGDLYTCFMARAWSMARPDGMVGMITIPNWMFISTYEDLRAWLLTRSTIETFSHNGRGVFGSDFGSCAFTFRRRPAASFIGRYKRLFDKQGSVSSNEELEARFFARPTYDTAIADFDAIPGVPIAYWASRETVQSFADGQPIGEVAETRKGMGTGDNARFVRIWHEVSADRIDFACVSRAQALEGGMRWFPYNDGGAFRKWYGNNESIVNWKDDGREAKENATIKNNGSHWSRYLVSLDYFFRPGITWTAISSSKFSARLFEEGFLFSSAGMCLFSNEEDRLVHLGFLNSIVSSHLLTFLSPTLNYGAGEVGRLPLIPTIDRVSCMREVSRAVELSKADWDESELSWGFQKFHLLDGDVIQPTLGASSELWQARAADRRAEMRRVESTINTLFIDGYRLGADLSPEVGDEQISLRQTSPADDARRLVSYALGCVMGRFNLERPGLAYASAGGVGFVADDYGSFRPDADGILPVTDEAWFEDEAVGRIREFILRQWGLETLPQNLEWLATQLGGKAGETPIESIRRYLSDKFYKDHLQLYKRRPIYWLFSSGRNGAFRALVYMHRYNEGTLSRMRSEYVVPLTAKLVARLEMLDADMDAATSASARSKLSKQLETLRKKQAELLAYDEKLRHHADMRIGLNLDDGVKANYARLEDLVAESKMIVRADDE